MDPLIFILMHDAIRITAFRSLYGLSFYADQCDRIYTQLLISLMIKYPFCREKNASLSQSRSVF